MVELANFVSVFISIYLLLMFTWAVIGWLPMLSPSLAYNDIVRSVRSFLTPIITPYVQLFSFVKPVQAGGMLLDLSFIVAVIVLVVAQNILPDLIASLG